VTEQTKILGGKNPARLHGGERKNAIANIREEGKEGWRKKENNQDAETCLYWGWNPRGKKKRVRFNNRCQNKKHIIKTLNNGPVNIEYEKKN